MNTNSVMASMDDNFGQLSELLSDKKGQEPPVAAKKLLKIEAPMDSLVI